MQIYSKITQKEIEDALLDSNKYSSKRWKLIASIDGDKEFETVRNEVKMGVDIVFDIRLIMNGYFEEIPQMDIVKIRKKSQLDIYEFWDEMEERDRLMKDILRGLVDESFDRQDEEEIEGYNEQV